MQIRLANAGIPIVIQKDVIVQYPLKHVGSIDVENLMKSDLEEPLLQITLKRFTKIGCSSIGMSSIHVIGKR